MVKKRGFTLIELLVVIAIIALLLSIVMPALRQAKEIAGAIVCMANNKQMVLGWINYAEDNSGRIVDGDTGTGNTNIMTYNNRPDDPQN